MSAWLEIPSTKTDNIYKAGDTISYPLWVTNSWKDWPICAPMSSKVVSSIVVNGTLPPGLEFGPMSGGSTPCKFSTLTGTIPIDALTKEYSFSITCKPGGQGVLPETTTTYTWIVSGIGHLQKPINGTYNLGSYKITFTNGVATYIE